MDFVPSQRLQARLADQPSQDNVAATLPVPVFVQQRGRRERQFARCAFDGFYEPETMGDRRYIWTKAEARVECHFPQATKLRYVWLEIHSTAPAGTEIQLQVNGKPISARKRIRGKSTIVGRLPQSQVLHQLTLAIESSTFVPTSEAAAGQDGRELGVAVRGIVFGKRRSKYWAGSYFSKPFGRRVEKAVKDLIGRRRAA